VTEPTKNPFSDHGKGIFSIYEAVTIQPTFKFGVYGGDAPTPPQGALPLDPTRTLFAKRVLDSQKPLMNIFI
jgi:hypothetical protein